MDSSNFYWNFKVEPKASLYLYEKILITLTYFNLQVISLVILKQLTQIWGNLPSQIGSTFVLSSCKAPWTTGRVETMDYWKWDSIFVEIS